MCTHFSNKNPQRLRRYYLAAGLALLVLGLVLPSVAQAVTADVVILDHVLVFNRLGAQNVNGMIYALERDVIPDGAFWKLRPDKRPRPLVLRVNVGDTLTVNFENRLRPAANPFPPLPDEANPCVDCDGANPLAALNNQVAGRMAGFHVQGMELVGGISSDASWVGNNANSLVGPGGSATYRYLAEKEGTFLVTSYGATFGGEATGGNVGVGAFAAVIVEPPGARWYRSQVTEEELRLASMRSLDPVSPDCGVINQTSDGHPIIDYEARYPAANCNPTVSGGTGVDLGAAAWAAEDKAGKPILNMLDGNTIFHADINAIIAGPSADGSFPDGTYGPHNPQLPNRLEAFREFVSIFHDETAAANAFPAWFRDDINPVIAHTTHGVRDSFMINYGSGGIGSEIIANRLGVGPMWDCLDCAYEEFFLTSFTVGDPAMLVDVPANTGLENCGADLNPANCAAVGPKATKAFYPADPANVHHNYTGDFIKFRNAHAGPKEQHIFHLHNHQWLFNANDDNSNYIDAQGIGPGSGYTYELVNGGSGNRNKTSGDAIYHCHFYPHFAQGMWAHIRNHDVMEIGTKLAVSGDAFHTAAFALKDGTPATGARALPDGEILVGTPIPAVVPLPGKPMAPMPAPVTIVTKNTNPGVDDDPFTDGVQALPESSQANVTRVLLDPDGSPNSGDEVLQNPGYPFWVAGVDCGGPGPDGLGDATGCKQGIVGQRPTTPPLDMITKTEAEAIDNTKPLWDHPGFVAAAGGFDGGLPRHALDGFRAVEATPGTGRADPNIVIQHQTRFDFRKEIHKAKPVYYPEEGTDLEQAAMAYHAEDYHDTFLPDGTPVGPSVPNTVGFRTNGALPVPGAPYQEPCVDDKGNLFDGPGEFFGGSAGSFFGASPGFSAASPRVYKGANIQIDAVFNKVGYHFPQQRIISLWGDVMDFTNQLKPPEPLVMRMNTFDCTQFYHTNLVPAEFQLDDYQVRTPTDIIGQHIHLPKWDLTSNDGAANGWNYEDGTLSPQMVIERIEAINHFNTAATAPVPTLPKPDGLGGGLTTLTAATPNAPNVPDFPTTHPLALGARVTIQRWFSDPVVNRLEEDRGLGIIFTHDHYGPSTHQQVGLYATVLTEPAGSTWRHNETGVALGTRPDGGPTSWQAIITPPSGDAFREFYFEYSDFQHAYEAGAPGILNVDAPDSLAFRAAINPSFRQEAIDGPQVPGIFPDIVRFPPLCPGGVNRPCPEAISADDVGMLVVNYRNEPVGLRVFDPVELGPDNKAGTQAVAVDVNLDGVIDAGEAARGDLTYALASVIRDPADASGGGTLIPRAIPEMNQSPSALNFWQGATLNSPTAVGSGDPFTPMLRTYPGDLVKVKIQSGAHEHEHNASIHGVKWLQGGSAHGASPTSGWRNAQNDGISEQFTFTAPIDADPQRVTGPADYAYSVDASQDGWWSGTWGLMRNYQGVQADLAPLPGGFTQAPQIVNRDEFAGVCPATPETVGRPPGQREPANPRPYTVIAITAQELLCERDPVTLDCVDDQAVTNVPDDSSATMHEGAPVVEAGGTLVYNPRSATADFNGPLHDPTALLFVNADDLEPVPGQGGNVCRDAGGQNPRPGVANPACKVRLKAGVKPEPLVLRAAAGDCVEVTLFNRLPEVAPDLAGYNTLLQMVLRDRLAANGVTTFNNNLIRPSSRVGLHPQLVEYDVTRHDGACVGINACDSGRNTVGPVNPDGTLDMSVTYRWYAGDLDFVPAPGGGVEIVATPVEFGGVNLIPADRIKQGQKGLVGALIIEPERAIWTEDLGQSAAATVNYDTGSFRDFAVVFQKGLNLRYGTDGTAVENIAGEGGAIPEDSHDAGQKAINYGTEPAWFRFGLRANSSFEGVLGTIGNPELLYSNSLAGNQDPATPVFTATAGQEARMRVLQPTGVGRGTTFDLHGHSWQRDPYLDGEVPSQTIGNNPNGLYLGGQESVTPYAHFDIVLPSAGGVNGVIGDYLFRDHGSFGNTDGLWGILRVAAAPAPGAPVVTIDEPPDGSVFIEGDSITFAGTATDSANSDISAEIVWNSSIDGEFDTGASVTIETLSIGVHTITASATDANGTGSDSITVTVSAADAITVESAVFRTRNGRWDVQGTAVSGAVITVTHDQTGAIVGSATAVDGAWRINGLPQDPLAVAEDGNTITAESSGGGIVTGWSVTVRR